MRVVHPKEGEAAERHVDTATKNGEEKGETKRKEAKEKVWGKEETKRKEAKEKVQIGYQITETRDTRQDNNQRKETIEKRGMRRQTDGWKRQKSRFTAELRN